MKTATIKIKGVKPLLMHNEQLANPLSEASRALKAVTKKKGKTDADFEEAAELEFQGGLYFHKEDGPYLPDRVIRSALIHAARKLKQGRAFEEGVEYPFERYRLEYEGPRTIAGLWKGKFYDQRMVGNQNVRILRTRPRFDRWSCDVEIMFDETMIDDRVLEQVVKRAGTLGLCDYRPLFGGFTAEVAIGGSIRFGKKEAA